MKPKLNRTLNRWCLVLAVMVPAWSSQQVSAASIGDGVDATNLVWTSGGNALWTVQSLVTHDGVDAAQSGTIGSSEESWLETTLNGPGTLAFWWNVSSEIDYDFLEFSIDGVAQRRISGEEGWEQPSFSIAPGTHTLRWRYAKDSFAVLGQDKAWLDEVVFLPDEGPSVILAQPVSQRLGLDDTVTFVAGVAGAFPRSYQWFFNNSAIEGGTAPALTVTNVGVGEAGNYYLVASNALGSAHSSNAVLSVTSIGPIETILLYADRPLTGPYRAALNNLGQAHQLFASAAPDFLTDFLAAVGDADPTNTLVIIDVVDSKMSMNAVGRFANSGGRTIMQYYGLANISSLANAFNANVEQVLRSGPLPIYDWGGSPFFVGLTNPLSRSRLYNFNGQRLQPLAGGLAVAGYVGVPTANEAAIIIGHSGRTILNGFNMEEVSGSNAVNLAQNEIEFLSPRPAVIVTPANVTLRVPPDPAASTNRSATFRVSAVSSSPPLTFHWQFNQTNLPTESPYHLGVTTSNLVVTNVLSEHAGRYRCAVTDGAGTLFSLNVALTALVGPAFVQQPQSQTILQGDPVTLTVGLSKACIGPFNYIWRHQASIIASNHLVSDYFNSITLTNVALQASNLNRYRCDVQSPTTTGQGSASLNAFITVLADSDLDRIPDFWELQYGLSTNDAADAHLDLDGDRMSNRKEYEAGTDPTDPVSVLKVTEFALAPGEFSFNFLAIANRTYSVQAAGALPEGPWLSITNVSAVPSNRTVLVTNAPVLPPLRYIRVVTPQAP